MPKRMESLDAETVANINGSSDAIEASYRTVNGDDSSPPLHSVGGLVQSGGYLADETYQRREASRVATEQTARRYRSTHNEFSPAGDSMEVARPSAPTGHTRYKKDIR